MPPTLIYSDFPREIKRKIIKIERELDTIHPGWRNKQRFDKVEINLKKRIKYCLKRHSLLTNRDGNSPAPLDYEVMITMDSTNPKQCYAHPIIPGTGHNVIPMPPESSYTEPECIGFAALAEKLGVSLVMIEVLAKGSPDELLEYEIENWIEETLNSMRN